MKISTRGRYALRMMLDIATNDHGEPVRIKDIAARQVLREVFGADRVGVDEGRLC